MFSPAGRDHKRAIAVMNTLVDEIGEDETHPLADVLGYLGNQIEVYEAEHVRLPDAAPGEVLRLACRNPISRIAHRKAAFQKS